MPFPALYGIPVLRVVPENERIDFINEAVSPPALDSGTVAIPFVRDALSSGKLVLQIGSGVDTSDKPNLVKTDAYVYSKVLDYVADAHSIPFADASFDFVYSMAVFEHLHTPWVVADEIFRVLKPGGRVYVLAAFFQHIHAYPHHYFNMTDMGLRRVFSRFEHIQVAPSSQAGLEQVAVSLCDLVEMTRSLIKREPRNKNCAILEQALVKAIDLLPPLQGKLIEGVDTLEAWRRIAPGFELTATRPK